MYKVVKYVICARIVYSNVLNTYGEPDECMCECRVEVLSLWTTMIVHGGGSTNSEVNRMRNLSRLKQLRVKF